MKYRITNMITMGSMLIRVSPPAAGEAAWAYAVARVERTADPLNPPDGEHVVEVLALPPAEALAWLDEWEEKEHPRVLALAIALGLLS